MRRIVESAQRAGASDAKVLITGESGVGKDVVAQEVHSSSTRKQRPYIAVNCAGFPETLLESELFGHTRGSFTGADRDRPGKLQLADGGTLFLDEVGEMSLRMQALLLRFLENGEIQTIGEKQPRQINVRLIAATNRDLAQRVAAGEFREDLLYRLRVIEIKVPALRERTDDIPVLAEHFLARAPHPLTLSQAAQQALMRYRWPGNVRELQNVIEQLVWLAQQPTVGLEDLPEAIRKPQGPLYAATRAASTDRRPAVRCPRAGPIRLLGTHPSNVPGTRSDTSRRPGTGQSRVTRDERELPRGTAALSHAGERLPPVPQLPDRPRVQSGFP